MTMRLTIIIVIAANWIENCLGLVNILSKALAN